jgi:hypothetical protein
VRSMSSSPWWFLTHSPEPSPGPWGEGPPVHSVQTVRAFPAKTSIQLISQQPTWCLLTSSYSQPWRRSWWSRRWPSLSKFKAQWLELIRTMSQDDFSKHSKGGRSDWKVGSNWSTCIIQYITLCRSTSGLWRETWTWTLSSSP